MLDNTIEHISAGVANNIGKVRTLNEDAYFIGEKEGLFIVSDGMGGLKAGDVAANVVVTILPRMIEERLKKLTKRKSKASPRAIRYWLRHDMLKLSRRLHAGSADEVSLKGMGATVVLSLISDGRVYVANMGDSRCYLMRETKLVQLTADHSVAGYLVRNGDIDSAEARIHPSRNILTRFIGMEDSVYPDVNKFVSKKGDRLLLCTDGLTGMLSDVQISTILNMNTNPQDAARCLVDAANEAGGRDNITALVVDCL